MVREKLRRNDLETGTISFFFLPDANEPDPRSLIDVQRFYVVLLPDNKNVFRILTVGRKKLPSPDEPEQKHWGFVSAVAKPNEGDQFLAGAQAIGEGTYRLRRDGRDTMLRYVIEQPDDPGKSQVPFNIASEAEYRLAIKNPEAGSPAGMGLDKTRKAVFPAELQKRFGSRKWLAADPPEFLDQEGAEFVLMSSGSTTASSDRGTQHKTGDQGQIETMEC